MGEMINALKKYFGEVSKKDTTWET